MHNIEHMLKSVGLIAYQIGSCQGCNEELSNFGPSIFKGDRISARTADSSERNNISVASFSGKLQM